MDGKRKDYIEDGFRSLLIQKFYGERKYTVDGIAEKMGLHKDTLYKWIAGRDSDGKKRHFPIDMIPTLVNATGDSDFLKYLCRPCGMMVLPEIKDKTTLKMFTHMAEIMGVLANGKNDE